MTPGSSLRCVHLQLPVHPDQDSSTPTLRFLVSECALSQWRDEAHRAISLVFSADSSLGFCNIDSLDFCLLPHTFVIFDAAVTYSEGNPYRVLLLRFRQGSNPLLLESNHSLIVSFSDQLPPYDPDHVDTAFAGLQTCDAAQAVDLVCQYNQAVLLHQARLPRAAVEPRTWSSLDQLAFSIDPFVDITTPLPNLLQAFLVSAQFLWDSSQALFRFPTLYIVDNPQNSVSRLFGRLLTDTRRVVLTERPR